MNKRNLYQVSIYDFILTGAVLIFSVSILFSFQKNASGNEKKALIYNNNILVEKADLSRGKVINLDEMQIEIREGRIRVLEADCPRKICRHAGWISSSAQTIVCVPNKILIEIVGASSGAEYDAVSY